MKMNEIEAIFEKFERNQKYIKDRLENPSLWFKYENSISNSIKEASDKGYKQGFEEGKLYEQQASSKNPDEDSDEIFHYGFQKGYEEGYSVAVDDMMVQLKTLAGE